MKDYIEDKKFLDKAIKKILKDAFKGIEVEEIESKRRDGFIPDSSNHGGYYVRRIVPANCIFDSNDEDLNKVIEESKEENYGYVAEELKNKFKKELADWSLESIRPEKLSDANLNKIESEFESLLDSYESEDSVLLEVRVMYHGENSEGNHYFTVDSVINWNAPYHRDESGMQSHKEIEVEGSSKDVVSGVRSAVAEVSKDILEILENF
jgi:hypothetical protein